MRCSIHHNTSNATHHNTQMSHATDLFILSAMDWLKVKTQRQKVSWYWIWKLCLPDPSTWHAVQVVLVVQYYGIV